MTSTQSSYTSSSGRRPRLASHRSGHLLAISDVAREFAVTLRTLRFYEDKGLLSPQRDGTARLYGDEERAKLALILKGKKLGFTLAEIRDLIAKTAGSGHRATLSLKPEQILSQIDHLKRQRDDIDDAITQLRAAHAKAATSF